ncbi:MAG TPA: cytochrome c oxidase subunit I [Longimicrobiales bacterium]|nr:cytochrome c oxidase subunit I [Longimicrobiales bacterium]
MPATDLSVYDPPAEFSQEEIDRFNRTWSAPRGIFGMIRTVNNIPVAQRYMATGFAFFIAGGFMALLLRIQLGTPENTFLDAETYNQIFTMHGTTMMFLFVIPFIEAFANYMLPLLLGTRDLPFPRLTALSYWTYVFGGLFLYSSFLFGVAPDGGWFAYVPLTDREHSPAINMDYWDIGLSVAEVAAMGAAAELIVAILRMRAPGMSLARMPLFVWAMLVTAFMIIFAFTPLIVGTAMLELDRKGLTTFFMPEFGGEPLLWQHLFWVFGHPEVYIMFLPAVGIVSHVVQTFARRPIVGYPLMVIAILTTGFLSFGLWVHHMFAAGISASATTFFTATSLVIAIPAGVQVFCWIATLWAGRPVWRTPLLFVGGFLAIFTLGGLTGVMLASVPFDQQAHDSFFVVAHFHYVLIGGVLFPLFAGLYYWLPKITGRLLSERLGKWNFWLMFIFFHLTFFPMHIVGLLGMPRRVYTYQAGLGWDGYNLVSTIGAMGFAISVLLFLVNFAWSLKRGEKAGRDPWQSDTLEWSQDSPPAQAQFQMVPSVRSRHPLWDQETLAETDPQRDRLLDDMKWRPLDWRGAVVVSVLDGEPQGIVHVPGPTAAPFVMSVGFLFLFAGLLLDNVTSLLLGGVITLIALVLWFRPQRTESLALEEIPTGGTPDRLPLLVGGVRSNGFWGTIVLLLVLATALATAIASYFYIGPGVADWYPPRPPVPGFDAWGSLALTVIGAAAAGWFVNELRRGRRPRSLTPMLVVAATSAAALWLLVRAYGATGVSAAGSAYGSTVMLMLGFQMLLAILLVAMAMTGVLWGLLAPDDPRGEGVAINTSLVTAFTLASAVIVMFIVYATPYLW